MGPVLKTTTTGVCAHKPPCPSPSAPDHGAARVRTHVPDHGYVLLCNGVLRMEDTGEVLPNGDAVEPHRLPLTLTCRPVAR
ncbi:DUF5999 family protein [Streptomyces globisporus]|uniref:DUF5999 family protein n=1 Tax=Streptomyces globisporus TaxID=1908 RepID=UPI00378ABACB